jgi:hypothetical protein
MQPSFQENPVYNMDRDASLTPDVSYPLKSARNVSSCDAQGPGQQQHPQQHEKEMLGRSTHGMILPDSGNLFLDIADVILRDAPRHMQATAERCGIKSLQLTSTLLEGVLFLPNRKQIV